VGARVGERTWACRHLTMSKMPPSSRYGGEKPLVRKPAGTSKAGDVVVGLVSGLAGLCCALVLLRWCRRRRFYKKVQRTMDEEELAFQKSLAKNYTEEMAELDDSERERLQLLENYMETMGASLGADEDKDGDGADLENVEAFLDQLSKAAHGADGDGTDGDGGDLEAGEMSPADQHSPRSSALKPVEWKEGR